MNVNIILFDDFETLDAFGPAQIFGKAPEHFHINYFSMNGGIVNSVQGVKVWTDELEVEQISDIVVIPGGKGAKKLLHLETETMDAMKRAVMRANYCLMIGSGSALLAQTGLLFRRKIADYPYDENWKRMFSAGISRVSDVRWMADGKYYSSSGSAAGMDMALGVIADILDIDVATRIASALGYRWAYEDEEGILL